MNVHVTINKSARYMMPCKSIQLGDIALQLGDFSQNRVKLETLLSWNFKTVPTIPEMLSRKYQINMIVYAILASNLLTTNQGGAVSKTHVSSRVSLDRV